MTAAQIDAALGYTPDPQVSAQVRALQIKLVAAQHPELRPVLEKAFATDAVLREFDAFVQAHGFSSHNVADAMAALLWSSWQIVNDVTLTETQIRGIHQQVRAIFLGNPQMRATASTARQMISEAIAYLVMVEAAAMKASDPARLAQARQNAADNIKNVLGLDFAQLEVTPDRGFKDKPAAAPAPGSTFMAALQDSRQEVKELTALPVANPSGGDVTPLASAAPAAAASPGRRIALVIGMSAYANVASLRNPASDARAVAEAFRRLGFAEVVEREDLTRARMEQTLKEFGDKANDADWAIIYYAGHGVEMNGVNYLVPVDARLARADHVEDETVSLTRVLAKTEPARRLRMVILDACRNNPFPMASAEGRTRAIGRGLSRIEPTGGVLVAYAARNGTIADDGADGEQDRGHSPFTQALLANLETPGLDIRILFSKVRDQVLQRTRNAQEPFTYGSLPGQEFYFKQAAK
jgi:uncharacterized caspase-like protein